jgi:hypothetical protein
MSAAIQLGTYPSKSLRSWKPTPQQREFITAFDAIIIGVCFW